MKQSPLRTCAGCGEKKRKTDLIRFTVRGNEIIIDRKQSLPGRGWYLCYNINCSSALLKKGSLYKAQAIHKESIRKFVRAFELEVSSECLKK